jgi:uncharacterized protein (UPF0332 family)
MDGSDFIELAGRLVANATISEASYRSAVSRAYYGAFHVSGAFLSELGVAPVRNANVHAFVRNYLYESGHSEARVAARELGDLQTARNRADYRLDDFEAGSREFAMLNVERALRVLSALVECDKEPARHAIQLGIAEYERRIRRS